MNMLYGIIWFVNNSQLGQTVVKEQC